MPLSRFEFKDLIDATALNTMLENLYRVARIPSAIIDMKGRVLTGAGWQRICVDFHRQHPESLKCCIESDTRIREEIRAGNPFVIYECPHGLVDSCCPVIVEGEHLANVFTGQLLHRSPNEEMIDRFRKQAAQYGFDEADYLKALLEVPVFSPEQHTAMLTFLFQLAKTVAEMGLTSLEARRQSRNIIESESKFRRYIDEAPVGVFITDRNGRYVEVNPAAAENTGYTPTELLGRSVLDLVPKDAQPAAAAAFGILLETGQLKFETGFQKKDGSQGTWMLHAVKLTEDRCMGFTTDITDKKRAESERQKLESHLRQSQKMEAMGTLAGGIAHDFNNILGAIIGYADMAMDTIAEENPARECIDQILKAGTRARDLVQRILTFSRKSESDPIPIDLCKIIDEATKLLRATIPTTVVIKRKVAVDKAIISADPTEIHQLLMNLCMNASHAMAENGGTLTLCLDEVSLDETRLGEAFRLQPGRYFEIRVTDTGCGIDPQIINRIFDPFFTTKSVDQGTGLGLSVVHGIVKHHNGWIAVESRVGEGTCFIVDLPKLDAAENPIVTARAVLKGGSERVLLIDDEPALVKIMQHHLQQLGYAVTAFTDANAALTLLESDPQAFDLVLTDQTMPGLTGDRLAAKAHRLRPDLPIVLCTGYGAKLDQLREKKNGIRALVMKPISRQELANTIRCALDESLQNENQK